MLKPFKRLVEDEVNIGVTRPCWASHSRYRFFSFVLLLFFSIFFNSLFSLFSLPFPTIPLVSNYVIKTTKHSDLASTVVYFGNTFFAVFSSLSNGILAAKSAYRNKKEKPKRRVHHAQSANGRYPWKRDPKVLSICQNWQAKPVSYLMEWALLDKKVSHLNIPKMVPTILKKFERLEYNQAFKSTHSLLRTVVWSGRPDLTNGKRPKIGQFASKECGLPRSLKQKAHWKGEVAWISGFLGFLAGAEKRCITTTTQESIFRPKIQDCCIESSVIKIYFQPYLLSLQLQNARNYCYSFCGAAFRQG